MAINMDDTLQYIFAHMEDSVFVTNFQGDVLYMNAGAEKLFGCQRVGHNIKLWQVIPIVERNDPLIQLFIDALRHREKSIQALTDYENADGTRFQLRVSITCGGEDSPVFIVVISDLTRLFQVNSAFVRYTSPEIADYVLNSPEGSRQGGRRKEVSVLMSDLRGFTAISSRLSSENLIQMLNDYFAVMSDIISRYKGTIIEFLGDGIFVVFGAPNDLPSHAEAAISCALEMQNAMEQVNQRNRENGFPALEMGIGISSGAATVGNIGSDKRMKFGCVGDSVNLAGRTESLTAGGQVLVTEYTLSIMKEKPEIQHIRSFLPKGKEAPVQVYEITGLGSIRLKALPAGRPVWHDLACEVPFDFHLLEGKSVAVPLYRGTLLRLSDDGRDAWIRTETLLSEMQNLVMETGEHTWGKVLSVSPEGTRLRFTFRPEAFDTWLADRINSLSLHPASE